MELVIQPGRSKYIMIVSERKDGNMDERFGKESEVKANISRFLQQYPSSLERNDLYISPEQYGQVIDVTNNRNVRTNPIICDGLSSWGFNDLLILRPGDCPGVALFHPQGGNFALLHCGRGPLVHRIIKHFARQMSKQHLTIKAATPGWIAIVSPGIGPCCYHFPKELYKKVVQPLQPNLKPEADGRHHLNLRAIIEEQLRTEFAIDQIYFIGGCSVCQHDMFSHSRGQTEPERLGRNLVAVWHEY